MKYSIILSFILFILGCGISGSDSYELRNENIKLKARVDSLTTELNDLKYGAEKTLEEAKLKIKEQRFIESKSLLTAIINRYPTSKEFNIARQLLKSVATKAEAESFSIASKNNNTELLRAYIIEYPRGKYRSQANKLIRVSQNNFKPNITVVKKITTRKTTATNSTIRVGAICCDGTRSYATGRGACSHHGGVCEWLYK